MGLNIVTNGRTGKPSHPPIHILRFQEPNRRVMINFDFSTFLSGRPTLPGAQERHPAPGAEGASPGRRNILLLARHCADVFPECLADRQRLPSHLLQLSVLFFHPRRLGPTRSKLCSKFFCCFSWFYDTFLHYCWKLPKTDDCIARRDMQPIVFLLQTLQVLKSFETVCVVCPSISSLSDCIMAVRKYSMLVSSHKRY